MLYQLIRGEKEAPALAAADLSSLHAAGWKEKDLENILAEQIDLVVREDRLLVISQERRGQEEPDILALDETGVLFIFELKRWAGEQSNLLQVIRYGQIAGQIDYEELNRRFQRHSPREMDLAALHANYFGLDQPLLPGEFNHDQRFVVITAGIDIRTLEAIRYWKEKGLPIDAITYHVYSFGGEFLLEFHSYSPDPEDYFEVISDAHVVNTNVTWSDRNWREMLAENKAAAYYRRKSAIDKIQRGDRVYLYHTGVGIVAAGRAKEGVRVRDYDGDSDAEHYVPVEFHYKVNPESDREKGVRASDINRALGTNHRFRQVRFSISKEMADTIEQLISARQAPGG